jgi:hypothetical protein
MSARARLVFALLLVACGKTTLIVFEEPDGGAMKTPPPDGGKDATEADASEAGVTILAAKQTRPLGIALSPSEVYWSNVGVVIDGGVEPETGSIDEVERGGGMPNMVVASLTEPQGLEVEASGSSGSTLVWSELNGGGSVTTLALATGATHEFSGLDMPVGVAIDGDRVYWASLNEGGTGIVVESAAVGGGATTTLGFTIDDNQPGYIAVTPADTTGKRDIFVTGTTPGGGGAVYALPLHGGTMEVIWSTTVGEPYGIAADKRNVYWAVPNDSSGALYQMTNLPPLDAGTTFEEAGVVPNDAGPGFSSPTVLANSLTNSFFLAVDSTHVYFTTNVAKTGGVYSVPIGGGTVETLADGLSFPGGIAADDRDDFVYFTTISTVSRTHK